jgi:acetylornithine deacetylase/succinyl-diaminopimelate desuccinylase-like protein
MSFRPTSPDREQWLGTRLCKEIQELLAVPPCAGSLPALERARTWFASRLAQLGFDLHPVEHPGSPGILIALRPGVGSLVVGLSGHFDVELAGDGWRTDPFVPVVKDGRIFARGAADNLGPLLLRLAALEEVSFPLPTVVWILQGEEEIGSPAAHQIYPRLALPAVDLWLEETGYFELDGSQRLLLRGATAQTQPCIQAIIGTASAAGRDVKVHDRFMNKAFGVHRCPFLTHLVKDATYLAIGPNDPESRIHKANESLPLANLSLSVKQFLAVLQAAAEVL